MNEKTEKKINKLQIISVQLCNVCERHIALPLVLFPNHVLRFRTAFQVLHIFVVANFSLPVIRDRIWLIGFFHYWLDLIRVTIYRFPHAIHLDWTFPWCVNVDMRTCVLVYERFYKMKFDFKEPILNKKKSEKDTHGGATRKIHAHTHTTARLRQM